MEAVLTVDDSQLDSRPESTMTAQNLTFFDEGTRSNFDQRITGVIASTYSDTVSYTENRGVCRDGSGTVQSIGWGLNDGWLVPGTPLAFELDVYGAGGDLTCEVGVLVSSVSQAR